MRTIIRLLCIQLPLALLLPLAVAADGPAYQEGPASRDGIGRYFMGREIARVMGHRGAAWLERPAREREERTDLLLAAIAPTEGETIADIGAGTGYFSIPLAQAVAPTGRVLAVDIQPEMLALLRRAARNAGVDNIEPVLASKADPRLPAGTVDKVLLVDAYHEFSHPLEVMQGIRAALAPGGRVYLVEYRGEDPAVPIKALHKMTAAQAIAELAAAGLAWERTLNVLPQQHILVFRRAED